MRKTTWSIADAKSRLSEVITRRQRRYVVVEGHEYARLTGALPGLKELILEGPSLDGIDLDRDQSSGRDVPL
jgi:hypothetical protein